MWHAISDISNYNSEQSRLLYNNYNDFIINEIKSKQVKSGSKNIAPSSVRCARKSWFRLRGSECTAANSVDTHLDFFAKVGSACHLMLQKRFVDMFGDSWLDVSEYLSTIYDTSQYACVKYDYETNVQLLHIPIKFSVDGLIRINDTVYILEIKSIAYNSFVDLSDIKSEHKDQAICYATYLKVHNVLFVYIDRTYGDIKCYEFNVTDDMMDKMHSQVQSIIDAVDTNIPPSKLPSGDSWCNPNRCEYYKVCKEY